AAGDPRTTRVVFPREVEREPRSTARNAPPGVRIPGRRSGLSGRGPTAITRPTLAWRQHFTGAPSDLARLRMARNSLWSDHVNRRFVRSCVVGAGATLADLGALWVMVHGLDFLPTVANVPALLIGVLAQFLGCKLWAFEDRSPAIARQGGQFALVEAGAPVLNALVFHFLVTLTQVTYPIARLVGSSLVYVAYSYPLWRRIFQGAPKCG